MILRTTKCKFRIPKSTLHQKKPHACLSHDLAPTPPNPPNTIQHTTHSIAKPPSQYIPQDR